MPLSKDSIVRVLQICSYYSSPFYELLFEKLHEKRVEQDVFYFAVRGTDFTATSSNVCFSECYGQLDRIFYKHKQRKVMRAFHELFSGKTYDVAHAHSLFSNGYVALEMKKVTGTPYIVAVRNTDVNEFFAVRPWLRQCGLKIMEAADAIVFISESYRQRVLNDFIPASKRALVESKSIVIPNGVNKLFLTNSPVKPRFSDGTVRLIQVGDINKNKNQLGAAKACCVLRSRGYDVRLKVIGKIKDKKVAQKLAKYSFVELYPPISQKDLIVEYRSADVFVMPSHHETFGLTYVEAMSQGLPVVYTKGQGFDGRYAEGEVGYSARSSDVGDLADAIESCLKRRNELFKDCIRESGAFSWDLIANKYCGIYSASNRYINCADHKQCIEMQKNDVES